MTKDYSNGILVLRKGREYSVTSGLGLRLIDVGVAITKEGVMESDNKAVRQYIREMDEKNADAEIIADEEE